MSQTAALVAMLKLALKRRGLAYVDVADALAISESSVKRLFADKHFSLKRLEQICQLMGLEMTDLFEMMRDAEQFPSQLAYKQEQRLVDSPKLLLLRVPVAQ